MIYLIHYDRAAGKLVEIREFEQKAHEEAAMSRLDLEIQLLACKERFEIVLLEAPSLDILKNTHRRYFESFETMKSKPRE